MHVHPDAAELGRVYQPRLGVSRAASRSFAAAAAALEPSTATRWAEWRATARADYEAWSEPPAGRRGGTASTWPTCSRTCARRCPRTRSSATAPATTPSGSTASSSTAARARSSRRSERRDGLRRAGGARRASSSTLSAGRRVRRRRLLPDVRAGARDDGRQERLPILVIVVNNGMLGDDPDAPGAPLPGRVIGTDLVNPDFAALARALRRPRRAGRADRASSPAALARARAAGGPALLELITDPEALTPRPR